MELPFYFVDAFADVPFKGNPAAVCVCEDLDDPTRQAIASEINLSETAFLEPLGNSSYGLRWFTPEQEVPLCGHATLASAHILWTECGERGPLHFQTASGSLSAKMERSSIVLDFPSVFVEPLDNFEEIASAIGVRPKFVGKSDMFLLAELDSEESIRGVSPDFEAVSALGTEGLIITAQSAAGSDDFVSRVFAPNVGIPEDPVTGSAHCLLAPYWSMKLGKTELAGYQASRRGGIVRTEFLGARTLLKGVAVTVLAGQLRIPR